MATFVVLGISGLIWLTAAWLEALDRKKWRWPSTVAGGDSYLNPMLAIWRIAGAAGKARSDVFLIDRVGDRLRTEMRVQI
jgi:hypothetical protein